MHYGSLKPERYRPRLVDNRLSQLLYRFGAVEVTGPMWCGKTWTSLSFAESSTHLALAGPRTSAQADPSTALMGTRPHLIDEWQDVPEVWDEVRGTLDAEGSPTGAFILTGSAEPNKQLVHHSGAGRIAKLSMSTMTLQELGASSGSVSLAGLFEGTFEPRLVQQKLEPLAQYICKGGWPALLSQNTFSREYLDSYLDALFSVSIPRKGISGEESRRVAQALARNSGTAASLSTLSQDARLVNRAGSAAEEKVSSHVQALESLYVLDSISGWDAPIRSKSRLRTKPKRYFADPSIAANLLGVTPERLIADGQLFGILFEALAIHDLLVYSRELPGASSAPLHYYRDSDGLEVDAIIELQDGRWAALEIKLGDNKAPEATANLNRLRNKIAANPAARNPEPAFCAIIVGAGEYARYDKANNVYIIPLTALGA